MNETWFLRFNDDAFTHYNTSGEAETVYIVREDAKDVDTSGKWIDALFQRELGQKYKMMIVELFPRKTKPQYTRNILYNRYICWQAAHGDIEDYRMDNYHGEKYVVICNAKYVKLNDPPRLRRKWSVYDSCKVKQKKVDHILENMKETEKKLKAGEVLTLSLLTAR